ncbi:MAG: ATP-binding protein [Candidatus Tectimicrobiota bacterium]
MEHTPSCNTQPQEISETLLSLPGALARREQEGEDGSVQPPHACTEERHLDSEAYLVGGWEMGQRIRAYDWTTTPLGPVITWPQSLKSALSILLPSKAQIVLFWGPELITLYNDAYAPVLGAKHPWALGRPAHECWSEVWHVLGPLFQGVVGTGEAFWAKDYLFFLHRQGFLEETYFDVSYDPVRIENGSVGGIFCIVSEQTGRVLGARRLRTLRELGTNTADVKSTAELCRVASATLVMEPADVPFALFYMFASTGEHTELISSAGVALDDVVFSGVFRIAELQALSATRTGRVVEVASAVFVTSVPVAAAEQVLVLPLTVGTQIVGALVAGISRFLPLAGDYRDFFELAAARISAALANAQAYEAERRRAEGLAELDRAKTTFFSNVSHEFRTPLTLLLGPLEDLLAAPLSTTLPAQRELLTVMQRNALRLQKLVNTLLDFARIEAGRARAVYEPADLARLTADLASNFQSACEWAGLRLMVDCPALPLPIYVDRDMWEKIVLNLLSNAFKYTFTGEIAVTLRQKEHGVQLAVQDSGIGIPAAELPHLFERFHRVAGARGRTQEGTGIGLALVQELVRLHGGTVRVESSLGRGSTFYVSLPTGTAHLPSDQIGAPRTLTSTALGARPYIEEMLRWLPEGGAALEPGAGGDDCRPSPPRAAAGSAQDKQAPRARLIWADDNADMRTYVQRLLSTAYEVQVVADGEAALQAVRACRPDLLVLDVMMPQRDGFEVLRLLRADPATQTLPVILLSARAGEEARIEGLAAGADAYLVKPFQARELLAQVEAHIQMGRLRAYVAQEWHALTELFQQAPVPIAVLRGGDLVYDLANPAYLQVVGAHALLGQPLQQALPALAKQQVAETLREVMRTGVTQVGHEVLMPLDRQGTGIREDTYWTCIYAPLRDASGAVDRVVIMCNEVTEQVRTHTQLERVAAAVTAELQERQRTEAALREQTEVVEMINRVGQALSAELELPALVQALTDAATALIGAQCGAFFYLNNIHNDETAGESYGLYTLSGSAREQFAQFPLPRHSALFEPTLRDREIVRIADVRQDARYGTQAPYYGLPPGHLPVTSYLAVPVIARAGDVLGALLFGHQEAGVFSNRHERLVAGLAAQAAVALDNARLFAAAQREIRERTQIEAVLREREQRYRRLFDTAGVSLWEEDFSAVIALIGQLKAQGVIDFPRFFASHPEVAEQAIALIQVVDINDETVRMFGARGKADLLAALPRLFGPEMRQVLIEEVLAIAAGQPCYETETLLQTLQGAQMHVLLRITFPPEAPFSSVLVSLTDITLRKQAEEALRGFTATLAQQVVARTAEAEARAQELTQLNAALREEMATRQQAEAQVRQQQEALFQREKLATMGMLLASVAHELNNPLTVILMQANLLRADTEDSPLAAYALDITEAATRCERLVRQFLTLARQHGPERTTVDLHALLHTTLELLTPALRVDTIHVHLRLATDLPPLWADPHQLQQVLVNLITNAQQALHEAETPRQLTLSSHWEPARALARLEVTDSGPGILPAIQARLFEPFFTTKPPGVGTGLGLSLCQGIVESHGGTISVRSVPGQGTTFQVELPVGSPPALAPCAAERDERPSTIPSCAMLLVDDEPGIIKGLTQLLRRDGHTIDTAANGRLALERLQEHTYDLILCDLRMPELDGPGLYRALEQRASPLCQRFIVLTGDTLSPEVATFFAQSGVPRLTKPFSAAEVRRVIARTYWQGS